ncbi:hypothetical protein HNP99_003078 [Flavobacterium sp. 28A]|uniref:hypothetical protein n=1 Tax=Flavobacterium sp. 28A TaxID=2735895 RepID=UPI00156E3555|nr:hypothetical protein [Flavobacterium sp. 28A]NRT16706.1 hypothetical protein [Flavobacterium sp. 28A]
MKSLNLYLILTILFATNTYAQKKAISITVNDKEHFIKTDIKYPITGTYLFEGTKEPIVQLNPNGTGIFQLHDQAPKSMTWGIECSKQGIPIFKEGFSSAVYSLWYKTDESDKAFKIIDTTTVEEANSMDEFGQYEETPEIETAEATTSSKEKEINPNTIYGDWNEVQFSIHFKKKKMYILGERSKDYEEKPQ